VNGKKQGKGKLTLSGDMYYEGEFSNGKMEGFGTFRWNDNKSYEGQWKNGCLEGFGRIIEKKKLFLGYFKNDKKHGYGFYYYKENNSYLIAKWKSNVINGYFVVLNDHKQESIMKNKAVVEDIDEICKLKMEKSFQKMMEFFEKYKLIL